MMGPKHDHWRQQGVCEGSGDIPENMGSEYPCSKRAESLTSGCVRKSNTYPVAMLSPEKPEMRSGWGWEKLRE